MTENEPDLDQWRERAKEARTQAEQMTNPETRRRMLCMAEAYERMIEFEKSIKIGRIRLL